MTKGLGNRDVCVIFLVTILAIVSVENVSAAGRRLQDIPSGLPSQSRYLELVRKSKEIQEKELQSRSVEPMLPAAQNDKQTYYDLQLAAKLYFQLKGDLENSDMEYVLDDYCGNARGCISLQKVDAFLTGKWIPQRLRTATDIPHSHREEGHWFSNPTDDGFKLSPYQVLQDWATYIKTRPRSAVPPPVRQAITGATAYKIRDDNWPGSMLPRVAFFPKTFEGRNGTLEMYNDTDVDYDYPHPGCRIQCRVKALSEAGLPLSLATLDGTLPDLTPAPGIHTVGKLGEKEPEEYRKTNEMLRISANVGVVLMFLIGATVPLGVAYLLVTRISQLPEAPPAAPAVITPDQIELHLQRMHEASRKKNAAQATQHVWECKMRDTTARQNVEQKALLATWAQKGVFGSYCDRLARQAATAAGAKSHVIGAVLNMYGHPEDGSNPE